MGRAMELFSSVNGQAATGVKLLRIKQGFALVLAIIGALLMALAGGAWWKEHAFLTRAEHARGVMVSIDPRQSDRGITSYVPTFAFTDREGQPRHVTSRLSVSPTRYHAGEQVDVFYEPGKPEEARVHGFFERWGVAMIAGGFGAAWFLLGTRSVVFLGRRARQAVATNEGNA